MDKLPVGVVISDKHKTDLPENIRSPDVTVPDYGTLYNHNKICDTSIRVGELMNKSLQEFIDMKFSVCSADVASP